MTSAQFDGRRHGLVFVSGFVGSSKHESSWIERTVDGGRHWTAGPVTRLQQTAFPAPRPATQVDWLAVSPTAAWAYSPSIFYTRDGGLTWHSEPGVHGTVVAAAVEGKSTWFAATTCRSARCATRIYQARAVGGPLSVVSSGRLGSVQGLVRLRPNLAWATAAGAHGTQRLYRRIGAGSWQRRPSPCAHAQLMAVDGTGAAALLECSYPPANMCGTCEPVVLYRPDGLSWRRVTAGTGVPRFRDATSGVFATPVGRHVVWAANMSDGPTASVLRSTDDGRTWRTVFRGNWSNGTMRSLTASDPMHAWFTVVSADRSGAVHFVVRSTSDGGRSWRRTVLPIPAALR